MLIRIGLNKRDIEKFDNGEEVILKSFRDEEITIRKKVVEKEELLNGKFVCIKDPQKDFYKFTVGKVYEFKDGVCIEDNGEKFPNFISLRSSNKRVKEYFAPFIQCVEKELLNGKFVCVKEINGYTTKGKVYKFVDGFSKYDDGRCFPQTRGGFYNLDDLNSTTGVFVPYVEEETVEDVQPKKLFRLEDYQGDYVMNCDTEEEAKEFCQVMNDNGKIWSNGISYLKNNHWDIHKEKTCYYFNDGVYANLELATSEGYTILNWSDFRKE